jgi:hypothetical protein
MNIINITTGEVLVDQPYETIEDLKTYNLDINWRLATFEDNDYIVKYLNNRDTMIKLNNIDIQSISTRYQREFALNNSSLVNSIAYEKIQEIENKAIELRSQIIIY